MPRPLAGEVRRLSTARVLPHLALGPRIARPRRFGGHARREPVYSLAVVPTASAARRRL